MTLLLSLLIALAFITTPASTLTNTQPLPNPTPDSRPACDNHYDDDHDGLIDWGSDPGCESKLDRDETG